MGSEQRIRALFEGAADFEDFDEDAYVAEWDAASRAAAAVLKEALPNEIGRRAPEPDLAQAAARVRKGVARGRGVYDAISRANGWTDEPVPESDRAAVVWASGAFLIMENDAGIGPDDQARVMALEFADWIGAVLGLVRAGAGTSATPADLVGHIRECPELDGELSDEDVPLIEGAFGIVQRCWAAAGVVDSEGRLTRLGVWVLPRMLALAWGADFDDAS